MAGVDHRMTIRDILEKVDLFNITMEDDGMNNEDKEKSFSKNLGGGFNVQKSGDGKTVIQTSDPTSAYLGPKLWGNTINIPDLGLETDSESSYADVINMDQFLAENNLLPQDEMEVTLTVPTVTIDPMSPQPVSPPSMEVKEIKPNLSPRPSIFAHSSDFGKKTTKAENTFLYAESKRAKIEREKEERRKKLDEEMDFAPEDLALATVPGMNFDPRERAFNLEELRPQPIIRKRKRQAVPDERKDEKYWEKRDKNKLATRRSREARRLKENQIALRAAFLEKENKQLKKEIEDSKFHTLKLQNEVDILSQKLALYEAKH